jgi:hypothetical protein
MSKKKKAEQAGAEAQVETAAAPLAEEGAVVADDPIPDVEVEAQAVDVVEPAAVLAEGEVLDASFTVVGDPLEDAAIMHRGAPVRLDYSKATDSEQGLRAYDAETRRLINAKNDEVYDAEDRFEELNDDAKRAKKELEALEEELRKLIRSREEERGKPQQPQLYPDPAQYAKHATGEDSKDYDVAPDSWKSSEAPVTCQPETADDDAQDETFRSVTLREMVALDGLPAKAAEILENNGLDTLGKVVDFTTPTASGWCPSLADFTGFGPKKVEQWGDACERFWKRWPGVLRERSRAADPGPGPSGGGGESGSAGELDIFIGEIAGGHREDPPVEQYDDSGDPAGEGGEKAGIVEEEDDFGFKGPA